MTVGRWGCSSCTATYPLDVLRYTCDCPAVGRLDLRLESPSALVLDEGDRSLWRYAPFLPLPFASDAVRRVRTAFPAGGTPLQSAVRMAHRLGISELWIKNEAMNPTGSLKDRASALVVASAIQFDQRVLATASTGNAALALAGASAACGVPCVVFVPAAASPGSVAQLVGYGATVLLVDGDYDAAVRLSFAACAEWGWYCRTSAVNPYTAQGKKTAALEIVDQLGREAPDVVVVSAGDGNILVGLHLGFRDAYAAGWIDRMPRLVAVQAAGASALYRAWLAGVEEVAPAPAATVAAGISVGDPLDGRRALAAVRATNGAIVTVGDASILRAVGELARECGVLAEASSAAAAAALPDLVRSGLIAPGERVVLVNSGGGRGATPTTGGAVRVTSELGSVRAALGEVRGTGTAAAGRLSGVSGT